MALLRRHPGEQAKKPVPTIPPPVAPGSARGPVAAAPTGNQETGEVIPTTRSATFWVSLASGMVLLVAILIFIVQNIRSVRVHFLTLDWTMPLALDILFAALIGGAVVFVAGSIRIFQLRRLVRRRHHDAASTAAVGRPATSGPTAASLPPARPLSEPDVRNGPD
jgi:uncharacterized integral membrane protein